MYGFRAKRGCKTGVVEAKLVQQFAYREQAPLFCVVLDLKKAYDAMDRGRCLEILEDCRVGPRARRLIQQFWELGETACRASRYYGRVFKAGRGVTQGGALSLTVFNLMDDAIMWEWITQLKERGVDTEDIRKLVACFYAYGELVASRDANTLQKAFHILTGLFDRVGL